jgi:hypothetical protein
MKKFIVKKELKDFVRPVSVDFSKASQVYVCVRESVFVSVCVYIIRMYVCVCVCVYMHTHTYVCVYVHVCICIYIYTYLHPQEDFFFPQERGANGVRFEIRYTSIHKNKFLRLKIAQVYI